MSPSSLRLLFCAVVMVGLAGCGGSSKGGSGGGGGTGGGPTTVTYTFVGPNETGGPSAVATQIGTGSYTLASLANGKLTITIPSGETNYSVAYICPPEVYPTTLNLEYIFQASILDGTSFNGVCLDYSTLPTGQATVTLVQRKMSLSGEVDSNAR